MELDEKPEAQKPPEPAIEDLYVATFMNPIGSKVLADILFELKIHRTLDVNDPIDVVGHNLGIIILEKLGVLKTDNYLERIQVMLGLRR